MIARQTITPAAPIVSASIFLAITLMYCTSGPAPSRDADRDFASTFRSARSQGFRPLVADSVRWLRYDSFRDGTDSSMKSRDAILPLLTASMSDATVIMEVKQKDDLGFVTITGEDYGLKMLFRFRKRAGKWTLVGVADSST